MKDAHNAFIHDTNIRFIFCDGHQLYDFKEHGVDLEVEGVRYIGTDMPRSRSSNAGHSYSHVRSHSSIIITCCIIHYIYIHNSGHVCHTHIKRYASGRSRTNRFSSKRRLGYYYILFQRLLFEVRRLFKEIR